MSDTESDFLDTDPSKLTVPQLKSKLLQLGVDLPMRTEKKQYYIDLFTEKQEEKRKEIEKTKRKRESAEEAEKEKATPKKAKKDEDDEESSSAKKNRKRRQSNPFQGGIKEEDEDDEEKLEAKPRRRLSTSRVSEPVAKTETTTVAVVEEVKEVATPSRRSIAASETTITTTTTTAPVSPSRQRRYTRTTEATPSTASTTPTRRTRLTSTLTQGGTDAVPATSTFTSTTTTPRRSTTSTAATTPYSDWRANRERRRSVTGLDTTNVPIASVEDADRFLTKEKTPEKPLASRIPGPSNTLESAPTSKNFDLISYLYTGLIFAWIAFVCSLVFIGAFGGKFPFFNSVVFCDTGDVPTPEDNCVICPRFGLCENGVLVCDPGYVRSGTLCIEDATFNLQAVQMIELVHDRLARKRGQYDCRYVESFEELEDNLIAMLKGAEICSPEEFDSMFTKAKSDFEEYGIFHNDDLYYVLPEDGIKPPSCRFHIFITEHIIELFVLVAASLFIWFILTKYKTKEEEKALARSLVDKTYEILQQQKVQTQLAATNGLDLPPYIAVEHIRDTLLAPPIDRTKRNRIWAMTTAVVHSDARVQETTVMLHGNQDIVWEWIAPVRLPKEVLTPGRLNKQEE